MANPSGWLGTPACRCRGVVGGVSDADPEFRMDAAAFVGLGEDWLAR